jgi:hypothetical protein
LAASRSISPYADVRSTLTAPTSGTMTSRSLASPNEIDAEISPAGAAAPTAAFRAFLGSAPAGADRQLREPPLFAIPADML